jgi:hypothetical protein
MRTIAVALACLTAPCVAVGAVLDAVVLPRPSFPAPAGDVEPAGARLELVSSRYHSPADPSPPLRPPPASAPKRFAGQGLDLAIRQPGGGLFLVYGGRFLVRAGLNGYAFDFVRFLTAPNRAWNYELAWAREVDRILYVEHTHLTYASATRGRNAYLSAIDVTSKRTLWRSPALVANARTFVVAGDFVVSGYGFTAEADFLYLLDRRTGRVLDRLPVPSAPERIRLRGDRLLVRTYDRDVVARIVR